MERRTRIVCTIGPATQTRDQLMALASAGMDVARINFSHGTHDIFTRIIEDLRSVEAELGRPIGIMGDIQGPKFRVGKLTGGQVELKVGADVWITAEAIVGAVKDGKVLISTPYRDFVKDVAVGSSVLLDDGLMALKAIDKAPGILKCKVVNGGILKENKGINVPEASFSAKSITEKDYEDILFCLDKGLDFIALSFVRSSQEIRHLKRFIETRGKRTAVLAKIEKRDALTNLDEIIDASDGVLVARGDLAVEVGNERVPVLQKRIVRRANLRGKSVIIATQMLMSMVENPRPTRAEASDVANAIVDGTDALMLSNETTIGRYPIESVQMMVRIIEEMETESLGHGASILYNEWELPPQGQLAIALLQSAVRLAAVLKAKALVVVSQSGISALLVSKCRPKNPVIAITGSLETYHQLTLKWGVLAIYMEDMESLISQTAVFEAVGQRLLAQGLCSTGDRIVITAGLPRLAHGSTNTIKVHQV
ncbi:MAG: pyruvate kinase [Deltaproteobacteria bacterium]|nr:pyruvate kinase [Deltaproteobacteria bacterium]MBI3294565.1 pyruvate kinase [Deltaproteobacteria bacterium]